MCMYMQRLSIYSAFNIPDQFVRTIYSMPEML